MGIILATLVSFPVTSQENCPEEHEGCPLNSEDTDIDTDIDTDSPAVLEISEEEDIDYIYPGETHFANMQMITIDGDNAEAYWNSDGTTLILQRTEEEGGCDQIFTMDLETLELVQISNGGATTCSYWHYPENEKVIYASTHHYGEECPPKLGMMDGGYIWTMHPEFDVFEANPDGSDLVQLTDEWGYDAECAYSHDGKYIIYCSKASGDWDLWRMDADGSNKIQLTDEFGYDGGPFFSWDSTKVIWRSYYPETDYAISQYEEMLSVDAIKPMPLQIWTMDIDGSNKQQITDNGAANFCPFFFPGDDRIIFTSNYQSMNPMDFNLWMIDIATGEMEQLTYYDGFEGFPMFSPDGTQLTFSSNRYAFNEGDTNVFLCDWVE